MEKLKERKKTVEQWRIREDVDVRLAQNIVIIICI